MSPARSQFRPHPACAWSEPRCENDVGVGLAARIIAPSLDHRIAVSRALYIQRLELVLHADRQVPKERLDGGRERFPLLRRQRHTAVAFSVGADSAAELVDAQPPGSPACDHGHALAAGGVVQRLAVPTPAHAAHIISNDGTSKQQRAEKSNQVRVS